MATTDSVPDQPSGSEDEDEFYGDSADENIQRDLAGSAEPSVRPEKRTRKRKHSRAPRPPPTVFWEGEPVEEITPDVGLVLNRVKGYICHLLAIDRVVVVYCDPRHKDESEPQLRAFHRESGVSLYVIYQKVEIRCAVDQTWKHSVYEVGAGLKSFCAVGLPVSVKRVGHPDDVPKKGVLGCCHCLVEKLHAVGQPPPPVQSGVPVDVRLTDQKQFVVHASPTPTVLGPEATGVFGEKADVAVTLVTSPSVSISVQKPWPCAEGIMPKDEVTPVDLVSKPVYKVGPTTGRTEGEVVYVQAAFSISTPNIESKHLSGGIAVTSHFRQVTQSSGGPSGPAGASAFAGLQAEVFAQQGDSGSVVFVRPTTRHKRGKSLGALTAVMSGETDGKFSNGVWVRTTLETAREGASAAPEHTYSPAPAVGLVQTTGVAFVLPYCYQIDALRQYCGLDVEVDPLSSSQ